MGASAFSSAMVRRNSIDVGSGGRSQCTSIGNARRSRPRFGSDSCHWPDPHLGARRSVDASRCSVVLVDPDNLRREQLAELIAQSNEYVVSGSYPRFAPALAGLSSLSSPDVLLIDADDLGSYQIRVWALLRSLVRRELRVIALTKGDDASCLELLLAIGVAGLFPSTAAAEVLLTGIGRVASGDVVFAPTLSEKAKIVLMGQPGESKIRIGGIELDLDLGVAHRWGRPLRLTPVEFRLLSYLGQNLDRVIELNELLSSVWGAAREMGGTLDQVRGAVKRLRKKIEPDPHHPRYLQSVRGTGYLMRDPFEHE